MPVSFLPLSLLLSYSFFSSLLPLYFLPIPLFPLTPFLSEFSKAQQRFAQSLCNFKFQTIGEQTEDEKQISKDNKCLVLKIICVTSTTVSHCVVKEKCVIQLRPVKCSLLITSLHLICHRLVKGIWLLFKWFKLLWFYLGSLMLTYM